jgi:hypothetical protein
MGDSMDNTANSYKNPFMHFYFWIKSEMMDLEAIQQAINARNRLIEYRQKLANKQRSDEQELSKLMLGKTTLKTIFKTKSGKEDKAVSLKNIIHLEGEDVVNYQKIISIVNQHISEKSIPWFKQDKMANYYGMLDLLCSQEISNSNLSSNYWKMVQGQLAYSQY